MDTHGRKFEEISSFRKRRLSGGDILMGEVVAVYQNEEIDWMPFSYQQR